MRSEEILIITNGPLCRNPRVLKEATVLGKAGYKVTVITVRNHAASEVQDQKLLENAPFKRLAVDTIPGYGTTWPRCFLRRLTQWAASNLAKHLGTETVYSLGPASALLSIARRIPADLVIVHNELPHWVGTRLLQAGRRVAADIEDWHSEDLLPADRIGRPLRLIRRVEQKLLQQACHVTTTSEAMAAALHQRYGGRKPLVITNSFPLQPDPRSPDAAEVPVIFWFSQTLGPGRGLETFFAAWQRVSARGRVVLLGEASAAYVSALLQILSPEKRTSIEFLPLVSPSLLPSVIARYDIGLALEQPAIVNRNLTITNKILQYLNAGLAVVATDTAGQREVMTAGPSAGILVPPGDVQLLAGAVESLLSDPARLSATRQAARELATNHYNWERESQRLLEIVEKSLA